MSKNIISFLLIFLFSAGLVLASDENKNATSPPSPSPTENHVSGTLGKMENNQIVVRVGDANKNYSFDNKTVFTSGDQISKASSLKIGDKVIITAIKNKAVEVNGTKHVKATVQSIDMDKAKVTLKIGNRIKELSFYHLRFFKKNGMGASVDDMKALQHGDSLSIEINLGFPETRSPIVRTVIEQ